MVEENLSSEESPKEKTKNMEYTYASVNFVICRYAFRNLEQLALLRCLYTRYKSFPPDGVSHNNDSDTLSWPMNFEACVRNENCKIPSL
jgi:hypothetical protein